MVAGAALGTLKNLSLLHSNIQPLLCCTALLTPA
jgi:hypothetical protein